MTPSPFFKGLSAALMPECPLMNDQLKTLDGEQLAVDDRNESGNVKHLELLHPSTPESDERIVRAIAVLCVMSFRQL